MTLINRLWSPIRDVLWDSIKAMPVAMLGYFTLLLILEAWARIFFTIIPNLDMVFVVALVVILSFKQAFFSSLLFVLIRRRFGFPYITAFLAGFSYEMYRHVIPHLSNDYTNTVWHSMAWSFHDALIKGAAGVIAVFLATRILRLDMPRTTSVQKEVPPELQRKRNRWTAVILGSAAIYAWIIPGLGHLFLLWGSHYGFDKSALFQNNTECVEERRVEKTEGRFLGIYPYSATLEQVCIKADPSAATKHDRIMTTIKADTPRSLFYYFIRPTADMRSDGLGRKFFTRNVNLPSTTESSPDQ